MDIDFHFGTIYVLARWAGFNNENARIIATSSQFVDDNISEEISTLPTAKKFNKAGILIRYSGHKLWENILNDEGNEQVWIPYHFLPGLQGTTEEEKLVCKKNSLLAKSLATKLSQITMDDHNYAFKLGIGLHVYADTWAHQEFSGIVTVKNMVVGLAYKQFGEGIVNDFLEVATSVGFDMSAPLGHAAAIHWPDRPYAEWRSDTKFENGRYNWEEFLEASCAIYNILANVNGSNLAKELTEEQKGILEDTFRGIYIENENMRNEEWINKIKENYFDFADFCDEETNLKYNKNIILSDEDFFGQFYDSLNEYYEWVKGELEKAGINRLQ